MPISTSDSPGYLYLGAVDRGSHSCLGASDSPGHLCVGASDSPGHLCVGASDLGSSQVHEILALQFCPTSLIY